MRFVFFYHSLVSDWNNGNAHFLRGLVRQLQLAGHTAIVFEPADGWSRANLLEQQGPAAVRNFSAVFPGQEAVAYAPDSLDLDEALDGAQVVLVHEWNAPELVARIGRHRIAGGQYRLFFHDTHHRAMTLPETMARYDLQGYDGVLAFGKVLRDLYLQRNWAHKAWTWHEAADTELFRPLPLQPRRGDLVWVGNWGDDERKAELQEFLLDPARILGLKARIYGVRYPPHALDAIRAAGFSYGGWLPNHQAPEVFSAYPVTAHIPRRPYSRILPGIPTIRVFEALACGIPLICSPWEDAEGLFRPGIDYLVAKNRAAMIDLLNQVLHDATLAAALAGNGLETIRSRHTCRHRLEELLTICARLGLAEKRPIGRKMEVA
ncbi:MAG: glycosyltransferase [Desulfuromonadales bacterium]